MTDTDWLLIAIGFLAGCVCRLIYEAIRRSGHGR
jgi:hypothetical protein